MGKKIEKLLSVDPIGAFDKMKDNYLRYFRTMYKFRDFAKPGDHDYSYLNEQLYGSYDSEGNPTGKVQGIIEKDGNLYKDPYVELLPEYKAEDQYFEDYIRATRSQFDWPKHFEEFVGLGLMPRLKPYSHQLEMLKMAYHEKKNVVITSGTGSGKTESFLLPLFASLLEEAGKWSAQTYNPSWHDSQSSKGEYDQPYHRLGEDPSRPAAIRAMILYPMNALVNDQMSRLRLALDSEKCRNYLDTHFAKNRIFFGRYNGETIGNKSLIDASEKEKIDCATSLKAIVDKSKGIADKVKNNIIDADAEFIAPRFSDSSNINPYGSEMLTRYDMLNFPPDIFITNVSMLSVALMRSYEESLFEETRKYYENNEDAVFHLIVDELHLHRGTAGSEVAYLLRMFLERIGIKPMVKENGKMVPNKRLRILASSASLGEEKETQKFLEEFFGVYNEDGSNAFEVVGRKKDSEYVLIDKGLKVDYNDFEIFATHRDANGASYVEDGFGDSAKLKADLCSKYGCRDIDEFIKTYHIQIFYDWRLRLGVPKSIADIAKSLNCSTYAVRGFFIFRGDEEVNNLAVKQYKLPRFRFHQFFKYVEGLWGELLDPSKNSGHCIGQLMYQPKEITVDSNGVTHKVLEVLRCEYCGTLYIGGNRHIADGRTSMHLNTPELESIPNREATPMVQNKKFKEYTIFLPTDAPVSSDKIPFIDAKGKRQQGDQNTMVAKWKEYWLNPYDGSLSTTPGNCNIHGYLYTFTKMRGGTDVELTLDEVGDISALPCSCPHCNMDYTYRKYTKSPVRSFRSGIKRSNQILVKELMYQLNDTKQEQKQAQANANGNTNDYYQTHGKLITFSDSRQDAAELSYGIATEHFRDMMRYFMVKTVSKAHIPGTHTQIPLDSLIRPNYIDGIIVNELLKHGINPGAVDYADQEYQGYHWDQFYDFFNNSQNSCPPVTFPPYKVSETIERLQSYMFNNCFSRYMGLSCEDAGLGYIVINNFMHPAFNTFANELSQHYPGIDAKDFLNGYIRVLGDNYRFKDPDSTCVGWNYYFNLKNTDKSFSVQCRKPIQKVVGKNDGVLGNALLQVLAKIATNNDIFLQTGRLSFKFVSENDPYYRCNKCGRIHLHRGMGFCTNTACMEDLPQTPTGTVSTLRKNNFISFDIVTEPRDACRINSKELTGQTDDQTSRLLEFKNVVLDSNVSGYTVVHTPKTKEIDLLNVTTTMEVGVDIGSLQAIFQGNMPPTRYNYQQRVGRGGRRGQAFSAAVTFCRGKSHDSYFYFHALEEITGGVPKNPTLSVNPYIGNRVNLSIIQRVTLKHILMYAFQELRKNNPHINFCVKGDTHGQFGTTGDWPAVKTLLANWITANKATIEDICHYYLNQFEDPKTPCSDQIIKWIELDIINQIDSVCTGTQDSGLAQTLAEAGFLPLYGMPTTIRSLHHGKNNGLTRKIDRSIEQSITEFAPGSIKTKDAGLYRSAGLTIANEDMIVPTSDIGTAQSYMDPLSNHRFISYDSDNEINGISCTSTHQNTEMKVVIPQAFRTGVIEGNNGKLAENTDSRSAFSTAEIFVSENGLCDDKSFDNAECLTWNCDDKSNNHTEVWHINDNHRKGYALKRVFRHDGKILRDPRFVFCKDITGKETNLLQNSPVYLDVNYLDDWGKRYGTHWYPIDLDKPDVTIALGAKKVTEVLKLSVKQYSSALNLDVKSGYAPAIKAAYYSAATLIQHYFADEMDIEPDEIEISVQIQSGKVVAYLSDKLENGAGFVKTLCSPGASGKMHLREIMEDLVNPISTNHYVRSLYSDTHKENCKTSCRTCLNTYNNQGLHHVLDWRLGIDLIKLMLDKNYDMGLYGFNNTPYRDLDTTMKAVAKSVELANKDITGKMNGTYIYFDEVSCSGLMPNKISYLTHPLWNEEQLPTIAYSGSHIEHKGHNIFQLLRGVYESTDQYTSTHIAVSTPAPSPATSSTSTPPTVIGGIVVDDDDLS